LHLGALGTLQNGGGILMCAPRGVKQVWQLFCCMPPPKGFSRPKSCFRKSQGSTNSKMPGTGPGMRHYCRLRDRDSARLSYLPTYHSMILATTPAPTVRPPSRIAKRRPSSIAMGAISVTFIWMLSPGITISTPSGSSHAPVTSVVRK